MKKFLITVLAALTISGAVAQVPFPDVPAGHWAGDAVARIAELGIVIGFPDGTFRGNESFTRYQAALVVSRLLDVIEGRMALTDADLAALRNALQELAADVAAQDVRLGAVEDAVSVLDRDVMSNTERIAVLEAAVAQMVDPAAIRDLQNQIEALRVAVDTATARAEAAEALANNALQNVADLDARLASAEAGIRALNELVAILNQDVLELQARPIPEIDPGILNDIRRNTSDIANLREFVILLRRDQVALRDRVAALEEGQAALAARVDDIDARVTRIEEDLLTISGNIALTYRVVRMGGVIAPFDVDRVFGRGLPRGTTSTFTTGPTDDDRTDQERRADFTANDPGDVDAVITLNIGFGTARDGVGHDRGLNSFANVIELELRRGFVLHPDDRDPAGGFDPAPFEGFVFAIRRFTSTFTPIGGPPLEFTFGRDIRASFTPYVFNTRVSDRDDRSAGFIATVGAPDFLAFLNPTLTIAYGSPTDIRAADLQGSTGAADAYFRAIRGTLSPLEGVTVGGSFAQLGLNTGEHGDTAVDNVGPMVWGVDGTVSLAIFTLSAEFANSTGGPADSSVVFAKLDVDATDLPILTSFTANYRAIPVQWFGLEDNERDNFRDDTYPFGRDQTGFGVRAGLELFIVDLTAYFDMFTVSRQGQNLAAAAVDTAVMAYGVDLSADLFAGFSLSGFFRQVTVAGNVVDSLSSTRQQGTTPAAVGDLRRRIDGATPNYATGFGVGLRHDGAAENALISGLNLRFGFERINAGFDTTRIFAEADYTLEVAIVKLTPYVGFEQVSNPDTDQNSTTRITAGTGLETQALEVFLRPSLFGNANFRTITYSGLDNYTATQLQYSVGLALNEFLFQNSVLRVSYGSYSGTNTNLALNADTSVTADQDRGDLTATTSGYEIVWNYWDLELAYGTFVFDPDTAVTGNETAAQTFRIRYRVNF